MECFRCHTPIPDDSRFCLSCGADVSDPTGAGGVSASMDTAASQQLLELVRQEVGSEFEVQRELGRGGMAIVYLATEVHLDRKVAIKVLPPEMTFSGGGIERFKREARTAATLDHPNIIPVYRVSPGGKLFWYAMKFLEGQSLADLLKEKERLPLSDSLSILDQVASALDYAHRRNVVHRDIKPANVMLDPTNRVIVTDFGIAKQLAAGSFTASGSVIGTPYYMSPEQCRGAKTLTGAADQYSVAVMTYQMLSGQVPFEGDSAIDILTKHCTQPPPPLDVLRPGLPRHVYQAIERALAKKPDQRFPTVSAFVEALRSKRASRALAAPGGRPSWEQTTKDLAAPRQRRLWFTVLGLAAGVGALIGGTWLAFRSGSGEADGQREGTTLDTAAAIATKPPADTGPQTTSTVPTPSVPSAPPTGHVTVAALPAAGMVSIDGQWRRGTAFDLPEGRHIVQMSAKGYEQTLDTITVAAGATVSMRFSGRAVPAPAAPAPETRLPTQQPAAPVAQPTAPAPQPSVLVVRTLGGWARIYVDNALRREGTSHRDTLPSGTHVLRFERDGYVTLDTTVTLRPGETQIVTVTMRARNP